MNKFIGSGRLAKEPECRYTQSGKCYCTFPLAMDDGYGEKKKTTFITIKVWEKMAETCANYLIKGQAVLVEGRIDVRSYEKDGGKRYVTEIVASRVEFGAKPKGAQGGQGQGAIEGAVIGGDDAIPDEDVPF